MLSEVLQTFERVAKVLLRNILRYDEQIIHFAFDKWITSSVEDSETGSREASSRSAVNFKLIGDKQTRPSQLIQTVRHKNVKYDFLPLSIDSLKTDEFPSIAEGWLRKCGNHF